MNKCIKQPNTPNTPDTDDTDDLSWAANDFAQTRLAHEVLPGIFSKIRVQSLLTPRCLPKAYETKVRMGIRLLPEVIAHFKASGNGRQTRIDAALRQYIEKNPTWALTKSLLGERQNFFFNAMQTDHRRGFVFVKMTQHRIANSRP